MTSQLEERGSSPKQGADSTHIGSLLHKPTSPAPSPRPCFSMALTGTGGHTAGTEGVTALGVGHGLKGVRVVGDQGWAVKLTDATVVEVEAGLGGTGSWGSLGCFPLMCQGQ